MAETIIKVGKHWVCRYDSLDGAILTTEKNLAYEWPDYQYGFVRTLAKAIGGQVLAKEGRALIDITAKEPEEESNLQDVVDVCYGLDMESARLLQQVLFPESSRGCAIGEWLEGLSSDGKAPRIISIPGATERNARFIAKAFGCCGIYACSLRRHRRDEAPIYGVGFNMMRPTSRLTYR